MSTLTKDGSEGGVQSHLGTSIPRSSGCVTVAAKHEAEPPNQNGYLRPRGWLMLCSCSLVVTEVGISLGASRSMLGSNPSTEPTGRLENGFGRQDPGGRSPMILLRLSIATKY